jgi:enoyl-CoA hydratase
LPRAAIEICRQRLTPAHFNRATVLAEVFPPAGAVEAGFLDRVVEAAEFDQELATVLAGIAQLDMTAHAATKLRVRKQALTAIHEAIQLETASYAA